MFNCPSFSLPHKRIDPSQPMPGTGGGDNDGPSVSPVEPADGAIIGASQRFAATITDPSGVRSASQVIEKFSTITCPNCGHSELEEMPTDGCQFFYDCKGCGEILRPLPGDCCVCCSYGDTKCPPLASADITNVTVSSLPHYAPPLGLCGREFLKRIPYSCFRYL